MSTSAQTRRPPAPSLPPERTRPDGCVEATAPGPWAGSSPAAARLLITGGPQRGREFALVDPCVDLGRGPGADFALADPSVSRRHSRVEKKDDRWVLLDRGSGNGTFVNGAAVRSRPLRDGDEIAIGDTRLRFLAPGGALAWGDAALAPRTPRARASLVTAALIAAAAGALGEVRARTPARTEARVAALRSAAHAQAEQGALLEKKGRWAEARQRFAVAAELDPRQGVPAPADAARDARAAP